MNKSARINPKHKPKITKKRKDKKKKQKFGLHQNGSNNENMHKKEYIFSCFVTFAFVVLPFLAFEWWILE